MKSLLKKLIAGFFIGVGAIIPGLSGGILAVSMGLYKPAVDAVAGFFKAPKKNFKFLLPLAIGGVVGLVIFMFLLDWLLEDFRTAVICVFLGLVAGSIPSLLKECNAKGFKKYYPAFSALGFVAAIMLVLGGLFTGGGVAVVQREITPLYAALCGGIMMLGVVIPGISTSFLMLNLGLYDGFLSIFTSPPALFAEARVAGASFFEALGAGCETAPLMLFALIGMIAVAVPTILLVKNFIERFHGPAYYTILGILLATMVGCAVQEIFALVESTNYVFTWWRGIIYVVLLIGGFVLSLLCERFIKFKEDELELVSDTKKLKV